MLMYLGMILCTFMALSDGGKVTSFSGIAPLSDEMIDRINSMDTTWKARRNFDQSEISYVKSLLGVKKNFGKNLPVKPPEILDDIPDNFDSRTQWPECDSISLIRDQAKCGSCWAFGAVEAMSDRICIASGGKVEVNISAEDLVACSGVGGCNGGNPAKAWQYWVDNGLVTGDLYEGGGCLPYSIKPFRHAKSLPTPACNPTCQPGYPKKYTEDKHFGASAYKVYPDVKAMQSEIMKNGPVEAVFDVYADFPSYESGVYAHLTEDIIGYHAIKIFGWGIENDVPYWLAANSWSVVWGDKGYFKIRRGINECGIEEYILAGLPKL